MAYILGSAESVHHFAHYVQTYFKILELQAAEKSVLLSLLVCPDTLLLITFSRSLIMLLNNIDMKLVSCGI